VKLHKLNINKTFQTKNLCLCIGNFDGIHIGHQHVIKKILKSSQEYKMNSAIMTFTPHPKIFFKKDNKNFNIITNNYKKKYLRELGIEHYIEYNFNKSLSSLDALDFIKKILVKQLNVKKIIVGKDFRFGKDRSGDTKLLKKLSSICGYKVQIIEHVKNNLIKKYSKIITLDGIKAIIDENTWILIRKSNTEDIIRISAESNNEEKCKIIINNIKEMVKERYDKIK